MVIEQIECVSATFAIREVIKVDSPKKEKKK